ncbi:MAG TPA: transglutaminase-like domain-containing protein [Rhizomicrobium sp.]|jgi:regulator of sirC expression with transglutaminase-like and TPR domain
MDDPAEFLRQLGQSGDGPHDIATAALMLAALDHAGRPLAPYRAHLADIAEHAKDESRLVRHVEDGARALSALMVGRYGYDGDRLNYDDPKNADFMAVIDRKRGLPVALGILYLHAARAAGFEAVGLNTPGHFLMRLSLRGAEALIDPFNGGAALDRERLGAPPAMGAPAPEDPRLAEAVSDIDVLLRLENNLKLRALQTGDRMRALEIAKRMVLIAPRLPELWIDLARLNEATGALGGAQRAYEACLTIAKTGQGLHNEAALALSALKRRLN